VDKMMDFNINREIDMETGEKKEDIFLRLYVNSVRKGLVAQLGPKNFATLIVLASYMDENGDCYPTQRQLAEALGVAVNTANRYINDLLEFTVNGKPIVIREFKQGSVGKRSTYRIMPISQVAIFNSETEGLTEVPNVEKKDETKPKTTKFSSRDVIKYWCSKFYETYDANYTANFGRDGNLIKTKLMGSYEEDEIKEIIDTIMANYETKWKNKNYPRPSIPAMTTFLANEAIALIQEKEKSQKETEKRIEESEEYKSQMDSLLENNDLFA
jgi:hypothetical protein